MVSNIENKLIVVLIYRLDTKKAKTTSGQGGPETNDNERI